MRWLKFCSWEPPWMTIEVGGFILLFDWVIPSHLQWIRENAEIEDHLLHTYWLEVRWYFVEYISSSKSWQCLHQQSGDIFLSAPLVKPDVNNLQVQLPCHQRVDLNPSSLGVICLSVYQFKGMSMCHWGFIPNDKLWLPQHISLLRMFFDWRNWFLQKLLRNSKIQLSSPAIFHVHSCNSCGFRENRN